MFAGKEGQKKHNGIIHANLAEFILSNMKF